jgi:hypothetical protein
VKSQCSQQSICCGEIGQDVRDLITLFQNACLLITVIQGLANNSCTPLDSL